MNNPHKKINIPKIYHTTGFIACIFSGIMLLYSVYNQFFYVDKAWFHGFIVNGFSVLSSLVWMGILFIFKRFLNKILNYRNANLLISAYLIFLSITIVSLTTIFIKFIKLYTTLEETGPITALTSFDFSSILWIMSTFVAGLGIIITSFFLGNQIRKIRGIAENLFKILGFSLMVYAIFSILETVLITDNDTITILIRAFLFGILGYILLKIYRMDFSDLPSSIQVNIMNQVEISKVTPKSNTVTQKPTQKEKKVARGFTKPTKTKKEIPVQEKIPEININELEDREMILSYYDNLTKEELNRLEIIVSNTYQQDITEKQKANLVIQYIADKKMYSHQRYLPK